MDKPKRLRYYTIDQVRSMNFERLPKLEGFWGKVLGNPSSSFWALLKADPKEGKSYLATEMVNFLAPLMGGTVCYCSCEEGISASLQERLNKLNLKGGHIRFVANVGTEELKRIFKNRHNKLIVIDSPKHLEMPIAEAKELFETWHKKKPCILVNHQAAGLEWDHLVDIIIQIKGGIAHCKGRFGGNGKVPIPFYQAKGSNAQQSLFNVEKP